MDTKVEKLAKALGAEVVGSVPEYSAGAFGVAKVAQVFRERTRGLGADLRSGRDAQRFVDHLRRSWPGRP